MSLSDGKVGILSYEPSRHSLDLVQAHSLEAWTTQWSNPAETDSIANVYSGGDDSRICRHRLQLGRQQQRLDSGNPEDDLYTPFSQDTKLHTAGVTAILTIPIRQCATEVLITGSYDEYIRVVAVDPSKNYWRTLAEERLHGGVWKLQELSLVRAHEGDAVAFAVLASCMHAGARVLELRRSSKQEWSIKVLAKFVEHESMNYASDARESLPNEEYRPYTVSQLAQSLGPFGQFTPRRRQLIQLIGARHDKLLRFRILSDGDERYVQPPRQLYG
ncbi:MAG: hypothetical protein Q9217_003245 [Psora testacea]